MTAAINIQNIPTPLLWLSNTVVSMPMEFTITDETSGEVGADITDETAGTVAGTGNIP